MWRIVLLLTWKRTAQLGILTFSGWVTYIQHSEAYTPIMSPTFTALDSIRESGITIASDGAEYKSKFFWTKKVVMTTHYEFRRNRRIQSYRRHHQPIIGPCCCFQSRILLSTRRRCALCSLASAWFFSRRTNSAGIGLSGILLIFIPTKLLSNSLSVSSSRCAHIEHNSWSCIHLCWPSPRIRL